MEFITALNVRTQELNDYPDHIIGIVESEKTAVIMTGFSMKEKILQNYIWMATGGLNMLKEEILLPLKNRKIILFPDLGINTSKSPYQIWEDKIKLFEKRGYQICISSLLEKIGNDNERQNGFDLADFTALVYEI